MMKVNDKIEETLLEIIKSEQDVFVTITGDSCVPCWIMKNTLKNTNDILGIPIYEVDMNDVQNIVVAESVMAVPTTIRYRNGEYIHKFTGMLTEKAFAKVFDLKEEAISNAKQETN